MAADLKPTRGAVVNQDIAALLRSRHALLWIDTREELRVERALLDAAKLARFQVTFWDCALGFTDKPTEAKVIRETLDPGQALREIRANTTRTLWVMRDLHKWLGSPDVLRHVRSLARDLQDRPADNAAALVVLTPGSDVPPELSDATVIAYPLPDRREVEAILDETVSRLLPSTRATVERSLVNGARDKAIDAAVGLRSDEIANCYAKSIVTTKGIDPVAVASEKRRVISREKVLEWYDPDARGLAALGGCDELKDWCALRQQAFSSKAREFGLPAPKGLMLVGVSGCGKSMFCKCVASSWGLPLLRLDMAALLSKWVGESEQNLRRALAVAEAVSPCVLWLDEVEKALAGGSGGEDGDGGVQRRAMGSLLTWMNEKRTPVFIVATANDVSSLPPEFLGKHRFDEVFFVDLPTAEERRAIAKSAVRERGRELDDAAADEVAAACRSFTGAEIASIVPAAMFRAFAAGRDLQTADLVAEAATVTPLVETAKEKIEALRKWANGRARPANRKRATAGVVTGRVLDLEPTKEE